MSEAQEKDHDAPEEKQEETQLASENNNDEGAENSEESPRESIEEYHVSSDLDHEYIQEVVNQVLDHYDQSSALIMNLSQIETISTAAIQAFISINNYAKSHDKSLQWKAPSEDFIESFNTLGLYSQMMQMEIINE